MASGDAQYVHSARVKQQLLALQEDFARVTGRPFKEFFCPILLEDKPARLCMGHIINAASPNSFKGTVVQRQDVDNFYGTFAESAFTSNVQVRSMGLQEAMRHSAMRKKLRPKIVIGGEELEHYEDRGVEVPEHTKVRLHIDEAEPLVLVVKKKPEDIDASEKTDFQLRLGADCRLEALVSLTKAAYLSLFRLLGYSYALDAHGRRIGYGLLGKFFRAHAGKKAEEIKKEARHFFQPYVGMMRTIVGFAGSPPLGTVEDRRAQLCVTPDGTVFGMVVFIRTDTHHYGVLLPYFEKPKQGEAAFDEFLRNDNQAVRVHACEIDTANRGLIVSQQSREAVWPKDRTEFNLD